MEYIKEMPYREKYEILLDNIEISKTLIPDFIEGHLGHQARNELQMKHQEGIHPIREEASFEDKYETA